MTGSSEVVPGLSGFPVYQEFDSSDILPTMTTPLWGDNNGSIHRTFEARSRGRDSFPWVYPPGP